MGKENNTEGLAERIVAFLVGGLFILSGAVKVVDPIGTAIKMDEYFEVFSSDFSEIFRVFQPYSLEVALLMVIGEVVLGVALIANYRKRWATYGVAGLIFFFTLLTFYSAYFNKVTDCGCFGDAVKLAPWETFAKDVVLSVLAIFLLLRKKFLSNTASFIPGAITAVGFAASCFAAYWGIAHLPLVDFRPYAEGNNVKELMQPQEAPKYEYIMTKDGKEHRFKDYPKDKSYTFKEMVHLNPEESDPVIKDFSVWNDDGDFTEAILQGKRLVIVLQNLQKAGTENLPKIAQLVKDAENEGIVPIILSSETQENTETFRHEGQIMAPYYYGDATVLKAIIRSNPGIWLVQEGVTRGKWHHNDTPEIGEVKKRLK